MGDTKESKSKKDNYWGYIIFTAIILLYLNFSDAIWNSTDPTARTNNRPNRAVTTNTNNNNTSSNNNSRKPTNYCSLSASETFDYLTNQRSLTLNGNGSVQFTKRNDFSRNKWIENKFVVSSNGYRLEGDWKVIRGNTIKITNYKVISGNFDASNNSASVGLLTIGCNGNLSGVLRDRNGNSIDISIRK